MSTFDAIVRPGSFEAVATGKLTKTTSPLVDAMRWGQALGRPHVIAVEGGHPGFSVCDSPSKKSNLMPAQSGGVTQALTLVGTTPDAMVGPISFWRKSGSPGPLTLDSIQVVPTSKNRYCILSCQGVSFPALELKLRYVRLRSDWPETVPNSIGSVLRASRKAFLPWVVGDGPPALGADWGLNLHGAIAGCELEDVRGDGFGEHLGYVHNVMRYFIARRCIASDCGRTMFQVVNREWELIDKKTGALSGPTNVASTPETALCLLEDNIALDCSSYPDGKAKGGWMGNGGALTVAGFPGMVKLLRNRIVQTHAGGAGITVWGDAKVGSFKTSDGFANGDVEILDNELRILTGAAAGREAMQLGAARSVTALRNRLTGTEKRVALHHSGKIGTVNYDGSISL